MHKQRKWLIGTLGILLGLTILGQVLIALLLDPWLEKQLRSMVAEQSQGLYELISVEANWQMSTRTLVLRDVDLRYDSIALAQLQARKEAPDRVVNLQVPHLSLDIPSIWALFRRGQLRTERVYLQTPAVTLSQLQSGRTTDKPPTLNAVSWPDFSAGQFQIEKGLLRYQDDKALAQQAFEAHDINLLLENIRVDSAPSHLGLPLTFEEIRMEGKVKDYSYLLADSSYNLRVDRIGISSSRSELFAEGIRLHPNYRKHQEAATHQDQSPGNLFEISIPRIQLTDWQTQFSDTCRQVHIGAIRLIEPHVVQLSEWKEQKDQAPRLTPDSIYRWMHPFLDRLNISGISVERGNFERLSHLGDTRRSLEVGGIGLYVKGVRLDSQMLGLDRRLLFSEDIDLKLDHFRYYPPQKAYCLESQRASLSTGAQHLSMDHFSVFPLPGLVEQARQQGTELLTFSIPKVSVAEMDLVRAWYEQELEVGHIRVQQPQASLTHTPKLDKEQVDSLAQTDLYPLISAYLRSFSIRQLDIEQGHFAFNPGQSGWANTFQAKDIQLRMRNFRLNRQAYHQTRNRFYADDIDLDVELDRYSFMLPDSSYALQVGRIGISTADSAIYADSLQLIPQTHTLPQLGNSHQVKILSPGFVIKGLDLQQAFFHRTLAAREIRMRHPQFEWHSVVDQPVGKGYLDLDSLDAYPLIKPYLNSVDIDLIQLDSASFLRKRLVRGKSSRFYLPEIWGEVHQFRLDSTTRIRPENPLYAQDIRLHCRHWQQAMADSIHLLSLGTIRLSTRDGTIDLYNLGLTPKDPVLRSPLLPEARSLYDLYVPEVHIEGVDVFQLSQQKALSVNRVAVQYPVLYLTNYPQLDKEQIDSLAQADLYQPLASQLAALQVDSFQIIGGEIEVNADQSLPGSAFKAQQVNLLMSKFRLDPEARYQLDNPFYASKIEGELSIENYTFLLPDSSYALQVGQIGISTEDSSIYLEKLSLLPQYQHPKIRNAQQIWQVEVPRLRLTGLKPGELYFQRRLNLKEVRIQAPNITLLDRSEAEAPTREFPDLYPMIAPYLAEFQIGQLRLDAGNFTQRRPRSDGRHRWKLPSFTIGMDGFKLDSLGSIRPQRMLYSDDFRFSLQNYAIPFQDSIYTFRVQNMILSTGQSRAWFEGLSVVPNLSLYDFVIVNGYTKPHIQVRCNRMEMRQIDWYRLLQEQTLYVPRTYLSQLQFEVEKDARFSKHPDQRPPQVQDLLRNMDFSFALDSIWVNKGFIRYQERSSTLGKPGQLHFSNLQAMISGLTNDTKTLSQYPDWAATMQAEADLMGDGHIKANFLYYLTDTTNRYTIQAQMGPWDMREINALSEGRASIRIDDGRILGANMELEANRQRSRGKMRLHYQDLTISVLETVEGEQPRYKRKRRGLASAIANTLMVRSDNPKGKIFRVGRIDYDIEPQKGFVAHWVQAALSGVKSSIGLKEKAAREKRKVLRLKPPSP